MNKSSIFGRKQFKVSCKALGGATGSLIRTVCYVVLTHGQMNKICIFFLPHKITTVNYASLRDEGRFVRRGDDGISSPTVCVFAKKSNKNNTLHIIVLNLNPLKFV